MQIDKIIILGGGSAGWMTASVLVKTFPNVKIQLIESPNVPTIGVGESTLTFINQFFDLIDIEEEEWMPYCHATYKLSLDFTNWDGNETRFHYPFGPWQRYLKNESPITSKEQWFERKLLNEKIPPTEFAEFMWDTIELIEANKITHNEFNFLKNFNFNEDSAYHFDATLFAEFLKTKYCLPRGVEYVNGTYTHSKLLHNGNIEYIKLENNDAKYTADLFIDCSGFNGLLIEKELDTKFESFHSALINDRALATTISYTDKNIEMETNTNATTMNAGWCWNIPLYNRIGTGYVYSSQFLTDDEAEKEFREYLLKHRKPFANKEPLRDFNKIKFKTGIREFPWHKNVVSIGLSCGFIEPLESTGLWLTQKSIMSLVEALTSAHGLNVSSFQRDCYNVWVKDAMGIATFILMHYMFAKREDTAYWKFVKNDLEYGKNTKLLKLDLLSKSLQELGRNLNATALLNRGFQILAENEGEGVTPIMAGMGWQPISKIKHKEFMSNHNSLIYADLHSSHNNMTEWLKNKRKKNTHYVNTLPTQYKYLKENIYNGEE